MRPLRATALALAFALAAACASTSFVTERLHVSDLLREPGSEFARELPIGSRAEQMQEIADTLQEAVAAPDEWRESGSSITVDGEALVIRTTHHLRDAMRKVLVEIRRYPTPTQSELPPSARTRSRKRDDQ